MQIIIMKCSRCKRKAVAQSQVTKKVFCEDHAFDYMIKSGEEFLPNTYLMI